MRIRNRLAGILGMKCNLRKVVDYPDLRETRTAVQESIFSATSQSRTRPGCVVGSLNLSGLPAATGFQVTKSRAAALCFAFVSVQKKNVRLDMNQATHCWLVVGRYETTNARQIV